MKLFEPFNTQTFEPHKPRRCYRRTGETYKNNRRTTVGEQTTFQLSTSTSTSQVLDDQSWRKSNMVQPNEGTVRTSKTVVGALSAHPRTAHRMRSCSTDGRGRSNDDHFPLPPAPACQAVIQPTFEFLAFKRAQSFIAWRPPVELPGCALGDRNRPAGPPSL